jgi:hypothetical protein
MSDQVRENLEHIGKCLASLPENALAVAAARLEGFAEGVSVGQAHAQNKSA